MLILATDTAMLGHLSQVALAAATLGNTIFFFCWLLGSGPAQAVSPVIAHIKGEHAQSLKPRDRRKIRVVTRMGLWSALLWTPPLMGVLYYTRPLLLLFGQEPALAADAALYTSSLGLGLPFALGFQALRSFATALGRPLTPMLVMGLAVLFNAFGDYALIFGHFGLPRLGLFGAGLASALSNLFSFLAMLAAVLLARGQREYRLLRHFTQADWRRLQELFRLGMPIGVTMIFEVALFNAAALAMGVIGVTSLAAHQVAITIPSLTFMIPLGIGLAATVRVGLAAGAGDALEARRAGFTAMGIALVFMSATSILLLAFPRAIASLWLPDLPENAQVLALAVLFLHVGAGFQLVDGLQVTASLSLRGLKDAHAPMWIAGASYWLVGAPACLLLGFGLGLKGFGIWLGLALGLAVAAVLLTARFVWLSRPR
jgi:MATE family multidrug resistance protein